MARDELGAGLRDQYFSLRAGGDAAAERRFWAELDELERELPATPQVQGLSLSFFPTARYRQLRFLDAEQLNAAVRPLFARPCPQLPELAAAFVDPEEFSFRSFENIVCLDRMFEDSDVADLQFSRSSPRGAGVRSLSANVPPKLRGLLEGLDELGLYGRPQNSASRGGQRFIFHCASLATAMTEALRAALPKRMLRGLSHVNPVFRCNRFEPGDPRFSAHVDSPYYDASRHHVSKYTLLLYLTGGRGEPALSVGDELVLDTIKAMTAIVFDQGLEHEGGPYEGGPKVFLRTELVFEDRKLECAPGISQLFAKACYLTGESVFAPELEREADDAYNRAAAARWRGPKGRPRKDRFVHKHFRGVNFLANGYDFWFRRGDQSLLECAALTLLDVLNAKIDGTSFHKLCDSRALERGPGVAGAQTWVAQKLRSFESPSEPVFAQLNKPGLFPAPERPDAKMGWPNSPDFSDDPFPHSWEATRSPQVVEALKQAQDTAMLQLFAAPILMMGQEVFLDPARFVIGPDKIHVLSTKALAPVHFAGAYFYSAEDFVTTDIKLEALQLLVPPILFRETGDTVHLMFDLFRNGWMVQAEPSQVRVPRVHDPFSARYRQEKEDAEEEEDDDDDDDYDWESDESP